MVKAVVTAEEFAKIDKTWQGEYEPVGENGSKYKLKVEPVEGFALGEVEKTLQALSAERGIRAKAEKALTTFVDDDGQPLEPAKARKALQKYAEMEKGNWTDAKKMEEQILAMSSKKDEEWGAKLKAEMEKNAELERGLDESVVEAGLNGAIAKHGAKSKLKEVLKNRVKRDRDEASKKFVARIMDDSGLPKLSAKTGKHIDWDEFFEELKGDPEYQIFFPGTGQTGTGGTSPGRIQAGASSNGQFRMPNKYAKEHPGEYAKLGDEARKVGKVVELHD